MNKNARPEESVADKIKDLLADPSERIRLADCVFSLITSTSALLDKDLYPNNQTMTLEEIQSRLNRYNDAVSNLLPTVILLARWGEKDQYSLLQKVTKTTLSVSCAGGGFQFWAALQHYPTILLTYAAGIAALSEKKYGAVWALLNSNVPRSPGQGQQTQAAIRLGSQFSAAQELFKKIPQYDRRYTPGNDYLHDYLKPHLDELLLLGDDFDKYFDEFEILLALSFIDFDSQKSGTGWTPPGRFVWKYHSDEELSAYVTFVNEAKSQGSRWPALAEGFFSNDINRFTKLADDYRSLMASIFRW